MIPPTLTMMLLKFWLNKTINGNNQTIYNLHDGTSTGSGLLLSSDGTNDYNVSWNKINFDNLFVISNVYGVFLGASGKRMIFNDCTFVAKVWQTLFRQCVLNRCAITFENINAFNTPFAYVESNFCWYNVKIRKTATASTSSIFSTMNQIAIYLYPYTTVTKYSRLQRQMQTM